MQSPLSTERLRRADVAIQKRAAAEFVRTFLMTGGMPSAAEAVEEAFSLIAEEVSARVKGKHYSVLIGALANENARTLKEDREDLLALQRLVGPFHARFA